MRKKIYFIIANYAKYKLQGRREGKCAECFGEVKEVKGDKEDKDDRKS